MERYTVTSHAEVDEWEARIAIMMRGAITEALTEFKVTHLPTDEEREYLRMALTREARRESLQRAIIDKTVTGLVWAGIAWVAVVFYEYLKAHGWKD